MVETVMITGMYDLHAHILPGVDDGVKTLEDSVEMAWRATKSGTETMLCTPHRKDIIENHSVQYIQELLDKLRLELDERGIEIKLFLGMENHLDLELPEALANGQALRINGTRYAMVELPYLGYPIYVDNVLYQLQVQGITPVLAHPERVQAIQQKPELLAGFVERGMLSQITAGSVAGQFGGKVKKLARDLLKQGLVHVLASDAHFPEGPRSPVLTEGVEAAVEIVGLERARQMVIDTPRAVLEGLPVDVVESQRKTTGVRRWWRLWRG